MPEGSSLQVDDEPHHAPALQRLDYVAIVIRAEIAVTGRDPCRHNACDTSTTNLTGLGPYLLMVRSSSCDIHRHDVAVSGIEDCLDQRCHRFRASAVHVIVSVVYAFDTHNRMTKHALGNVGTDTNTGRQWPRCSPEWSKRHQPRHPVSWCKPLRVVARSTTKP